MPEFVVQVARLPVGDYLVDGRFLFERKSLPDLVTSITSGRLFRQALRLTEVQPPRPVLVLEGTAKNIEGYGIGWEAVQGALITVSLFIGLPVLRTRCAQETAQTFLYVTRQSQAIASGALPRKGKRPRGKRALQSYLLQGLPGIGPGRAARLLDRFGRVETVLCASADELESITGIGRHTASLIRWAVGEEAAPYNLSSAHREQMSGRDFAGFSVGVVESYSESSSAS